MQEHFSQWIDSFWHKQDPINISNISGLASRLNTIEAQLAQKADAAALSKIYEIIRNDLPIEVIIRSGDQSASGIIAASPVDRAIKCITVSDSKVLTIKYADEQTAIDVVNGKACDIPIPYGKAHNFTVDLGDNLVGKDVVVTLYMEYKF